MEKISNKFPRLLKYFENVNIIISFLGMFFIFAFLVYATINLILNPDSQPALAPVLPGVQISPDLPILGFWHWVIAILFIAVVHEFSHGIYSVYHKIKVKSSGFAFLGPILAAFVEPDEKSLNKKSPKAQLSVFAAGPSSNIYSFIIIFLISLFIINPFAASYLEYEDVKIINVEQDSPFFNAGVGNGEIITSFNDKEIKSLDDFKDTLKDIKPEDNVDLLTLNNSYTIEIGEKNNNTFLGVTLTSDNVNIKEGFLNSIIGNTMVWVAKLFSWVYIISLGVGLFNLLPLGPIDGGRMLNVMLLRFFNERKAKKIWLYVSFFCLFLIFVNLLPYFFKLFYFILNNVS